VAALATAAWRSWSIGLPGVLLFDTAALYWIGSRSTFTPYRLRVQQRWRTASFYSGLVVLAIAVCSPLDALSERLFWAHMLQHVLLLVVAPPLIVYAQPWVRLWRALPVQTRRSLARGLSQGRHTAPLRALCRVLGRPDVSFLLFSGVLLAWHVPAMFDATLHSLPLHALEHVLFFWTALLFWKQVIPSPPLRAPLASSQRVLYTVGAMVVSWILAVVLALAPHALYDTYAHEATRPGGISALADQQLAAGIMWVPGSITFLIVILAHIQRWVAPPAPDSARRARLAR
jgi:cytochrome c oxidase assembly factor CtaG